MSATTVFAPGKLFVIGEYAVLHGARALVAAVSAGIACRCLPASAWRIAAPDLGLDFAIDGVPRDSAAALLASAATAARDELAIASPLSFEVRGSELASRGKYGLGGSAASVVAILGAAAVSAGLDLDAKGTRARLFSLAFSVHREHQRGRGSGADVAASVYGGWLDYALGEGGARIAPAAMPSGIRLGAVWSGVASDTARAIEAFESPPVLGRLRSIVERFWVAVERADRAGIGREIDAYGEALESIDGGAGARRIADLVKRARALGFAAKGSGAVGGDCAIAVGFDPVDCARLEMEWRNAGAEPLGVAIDSRGVRRTTGSVHA